MSNYPKLKEILSELDARGLLKNCPQDLREREVFGAYCDSRRYKRGGIFICKGRDFKDDYLDYVKNRGCEVYFHSGQVDGGIEVTDIRQAMAIISRIAWEKPDLNLKIIGITGTKGKTTVANFVKSVIDSAYQVCGMIGTHHVFDGAKHITTPNTTPEAPELYEYLSEMVKNRCTYCVMEISSQALKYDRLGDMDIDVACITNIGVDHISEVEHPSLEDYVNSKFLIQKLAKKVVISDHLPLVGDVEELVEKQLKSANSNFCAFGDTNNDIELEMIGKFNQDNARAAIKICELLGFDKELINRTIKTAKVPGRMEITPTRDGRLIGIVDYAHTKESYELFFSAINEKYRDAYKIVYFGSSGGKAVSRQVDLPMVASKYANFIIITSDDPGDEDPRILCEKVASHLELDESCFCIEENRDKACAEAFEVANNMLEKHATVVVCALGKGDEDVCVAKPHSIPIIPDTSHVKKMIEEYNERL